MWILSEARVVRAGQDRAWAVLDGDAVWLALADGAGGVSGGAAAAARVVDAFRVARPRSATACAELLGSLDAALMGHGETTAIVARADGERVVGASAGDSRLYVQSGGWVDATRHQRRARLGAGATPVPFVVTGPAALVAFTDGLDLGHDDPAIDASRLLALHDLGDDDATVVVAHR